MSSADRNEKLRTVISTVKRRTANQGRWRTWRCRFVGCTSDAVNDAALLLGLEDLCVPSRLARDRWFGKWSCVLSLQPIHEVDLHEPHAKSPSPLFSQIVTTSRAILFEIIHSPCHLVLSIIIPPPVDKPRTYSLCIASSPVLTTAEHFYDRNSHVRVSSSFGEPDSRNSLRSKLYIKQQPPSTKTTGSALLPPAVRDTSNRPACPTRHTPRSRLLQKPHITKTPNCSEQRPESLYLAGPRTLFFKVCLGVILSCAVHDTRCVYDCWFLSVFVSYSCSWLPHF